MGLIWDLGHCSFTPVFLSLLLSCVTELTDRIRANSSPDASEVEDSAIFVSFFPDFVWTLRDFSLDLEADGQAISADQYLENSLKLKQGKGDFELITENDKTLETIIVYFSVYSFLIFMVFYFSSAG